jgi:hypothetical protein
VRAASDFGNRRVHGNPSNQRREVFEHRNGRVAKPLVVPEMAADKSQLRAEFARLATWHSASSAKALAS